MPLGILAQVPHKGKGGGPALRQLASASPAPFFFRSSPVSLFFLIHPICRSKWNSKRLDGGVINSS